VKFIDMTSCMSDERDNHSYYASVVRGSSQSISLCHNCCMNILALIVTGDKTLMRSNTLDIIACGTHELYGMESSTPNF